MTVDPSACVFSHQCRTLAASVLVGTRHATAESGCMCEVGVALGVSSCGELRGWVGGGVNEIADLE